MNKFDDVFACIKKHCEEERKLAEISCFEAIARETNISVSRLPMYLNHLKEIGLINYSIADKFIHLTAAGRKHEPAALKNNNAQLGSGAYAPSMKHNSLC